MVASRDARDVIDMVRDVRHGDARFGVGAATLACTPNSSSVSSTIPSSLAPPPVRTTPVFEAPLGQYQWLGQGAYVGTLGFDPTVREPHVVITIYRAN